MLLSTNLFTDPETHSFTDSSKFASCELKMPQSLPSASSSQSHCFFRVLLPGFRHNLRLPTKFVKNVLAKEKSGPESASLVNQIGESWHVDVYKYGNQEVCIGGPGWTALARAHNLGMGYFLTFGYRGEMVFDFRAFDLTCCEIAYPSIARWVAPRLKARKPVLIDVKDECCNNSNASTVSPTEEKEKGAAKKKAIRGVRFETKLSAYYMSKGDIQIPTRFKESTGLWEQEELSLEDPKGRLWTVGLRRRRSRAPGKPQRCCMARGWLAFARANKLEGGDRCIFKLVSQGKGKENVMQVKIVKKHELET